MLSILYSLLIFKYKIATWLFSFTNTKAKSRIEGLGRQQSNLNHQLSKISSRRILVHCASLGEYEQATPVIRWILENTDFGIVVSFFSPSGYENCVLPNTRCVKCYFPFDLKTDIGPFLKKISPDKVIITKNEWWWNMLSILQSNQTDTYLISSTIRDDHYFIKYPLSFFKNRLNAFSSIFVLNNDSKKALSGIYRGEIFVSGDTRKDQVLNIKKEVTSDHEVTHTVIYGSAWIDDLHIIKQIIRELPNYNHFIYPHDLNIDNVNAICSQLDCKTINTISNLSGTYVIDSMGQLKKDYAKAQIAYIGGGFGEGIHNILEAAVYRIPTLFGPRFSKSLEASELIDLGVAFPLSYPSEVNRLIIKLRTNEYQEEINLKLIDYFSASKSATDIICANIFK